MKLEPQDLEKVTLPESELTTVGKKSEMSAEKDTSVVDLLRHGTDLSKASERMNADTVQVPDTTAGFNEHNADNMTAGSDMLQDNSLNLTYRAVVGVPLEKGMPKASKEDIISALRAVQDPELFLSVYDLGLIYELNRSENGDVKIVMTLTSPTCPIAGEMPAMVANAVASVPGTGIITVELTFDPPWTTDQLSDEIKILMGID